MHFEALHVQRTPKPTVLSASIGDEVYTGAQAQWDRLTRADRRWVHDTLDDALTAWIGPTRAAETTAWRITGPAHDDDPTPYALTWRDTSEDAPHHAPAWDALDPDAQRRISDALDAILEAIHALLII